MNNFTTVSSPSDCVANLVYLHTISIFNTSEYRLQNLIGFEKNVWLFILYWHICNNIISTHLVLNENELNEFEGVTRVISKDCIKNCRLNQ